MNDVFSVSCIYQAAALILALKIKPELIMRGNSVLFQFPTSEALYRALSLYGNGEMEGTLFTYSQVIKALRAEMYSVKQGARNDR